ncbi:glycosyltransferase family 4 protein [Neobacillus pocheonensis]|uniref:Glycosyltransferase family 4 protein n=1 Tax=Neobacillus pocheonensis TaxID=363869 RepID=A0ABT0WIL2_9BACI|nr:glycosyltransferase family 4 protein [Neobacillus pocheonensis]
MKISIILNNISGKGGVERVVTSLSNQLYNRYNCETHIISLFSNDESDIFYETNPNIEVIHLGNKSLKNVRVLRQFLDFNKQKYDYMLCCSVSISTIALFSKIIGKTSTKIFAWEHSQYGNASNSIKGLRRVIYPYLDRIIPLSNHDGNIFKKYIKNVSVIPNFKPFTTSQTSNFKNNTLITVGRLEHEKGFDMLIDSFNLIENQIGDWKLEIYGEGKEYHSLVERIKSYGLENKISIKPFTSKIKEKYLNSSIFVCSSRSESFSMVLIEAMECGLPCISFNCKIGPKEIISDGIDGFLVEPCDINDLSTRMEMLIKDSNLRVEMGFNAKKKSKKYDVEGTMQLWESILGIEKEKMGNLK